MKKIIFLVAIFFISFLLRADDFKVEEETWAVIKLDGQKIGYSKEVLLHSGSNLSEKWRSENFQKFKLKRLNSNIEMEISTALVEDGNGVVLDFESRTQGAGTNVALKGHREGNEIVVEGQRYGIPKNISGPILVEREIQKMPLKAGSRLEKIVFMPDFPNAPLELTVEIKGEETKVIEGKEMKLWRVDSEMSAFPGMVTSSWVDEKFQEKYALIPFAGMGTLERITTTEKEAVQSFDGAEIFSKSLIVPSRPLGNVRQLQKAVYRFKAPPSQSLVFWNGAEQTVVSSQKNIADITVVKPQFDENAITWRLPYQGELKDYLKATSFLEISDPLIVELAKNAVGGETHPLRAAQKIEKFVRTYIQQKDLSVGLATALETAKSRTGDCTESAVLAAALGRAVGLPTQVVVGLAYVPEGVPNGGKFGFHMWAEGWIAKDQWVAMDPSLGVFDMGHIAVKKIQPDNLSISEIFTSIFSLLDGLQIEVLSTE